MALAGNAAQHAFAQAGHQHQVAAAQQLDRGAQLGRVLVAEVGEHDDERAPALHAQQFLRGQQVVRMVAPGWMSCRRFIRALSVAAPLRGAKSRPLPRRAAEGHRADLVALLERDVGSAASAR
jgi:hypothetical protein